MTGSARRHRRGSNINNNSTSINSFINNNNETINGTVSLLHNIILRKHRTAVDDAVSKNISIILENLLKSYENSQLPTHGLGIKDLLNKKKLIKIIYSYIYLFIFYK